MGALTENPVLVAVDDPQLLLAAQRVVALAGAHAQVVSPAVAAARWPTASAVVVDAASAAALGALPRRGRVAVVTASTAEPDAWRAAVAVGADIVAALPDDERALLDWLVAPLPSGRTGAVVCCVGARGGAGTSTLAAALALTAADSGRAALIDADPAAGGIDLLLGIEDVAGTRWSDLDGSSGPLRAGVLDGLPAAGGAAVLSCTAGSAPMGAAAVASVTAAARAAYDVVVVDAPTDVGAFTGATAVLVVPSEVRAVRAAAARVAAMNDIGVGSRVVVRTPGPGDLRARHVADALGVPAVVEWRWQRRLDGAVDAGRFLDSWRRTGVADVARRLLEAVQPR